VKQRKKNKKKESKLINKAFQKSPKRDNKKKSFERRTRKNLREIWQREGGNARKMNKPREITSEFRVYIVVVEFMKQYGILEKIGEKLRVERKKGTSDIEIVLFLLAYFGNKARGSLAEFYMLLKPYMKELAGVANRKTLPSESSISRFLSKVQSEDAEGFAGWLISELVKAEGLLKKQVAGVLDAKGTTWHFVDFDLQEITVLQRRLQSGEMYPKPKRLVEKPESESHKERRVHHYYCGYLRHSGTTLQFGAFIEKEKGKFSSVLERAIKRLHVICEAAGLKKETVVLRFDNEGGNDTCIRMCCDNGYGVVSRVTWYNLLANEAIQKRLQESSWEAVYNSGCGPQREATECFTVWLWNGTAYLSKQQIERAHQAVALQLRVVVSRYRGSKKEKSGIAGYESDGWIYELFCATVPGSGFSPADVVSEYFSRAGMENGIHYNNTKMRTQHLYSRNLPGQELVLNMSLFCSNMAVLHGWVMEGKEEEQVRVESRLSQPDNQVFPCEAVASLPPVVCSGSVPETADVAILPQSVCASGSVEADRSGCETQTVSEPAVMNTTLSQGGPPEHSSSPCSAPFSPSVNPNDLNQTTNVKQLILEELKTGTYSFNKKLFHFLPLLCMFLCLKNCYLKIHRLLSNKSGYTLIFRAKKSDCKHCQFRPTCSPSTAHYFRRELSISVPKPLVAIIKQRLLALPSASPTLTANTSGLPPPSPSFPLPPDPFVSQPLGSLLLTPAVFYGVKYQNTFYRYIQSLQILVYCEPAPSSPPITISQLRQRSNHRRFTWQERHECNQIPVNQVHRSFTTDNPKLKSFINYYQLLS
jgi:hypothetical protein